MMFIVVDLPEPDAPMIATNSPSRIVSETPRKRVHINIAHRVGLVDVIQLNHRARFRLLAPAAAALTGITASCSYEVLLT